MAPVGKRKTFKYGVTLTLSTRELSAVLAGLQYWRREGVWSSGTEQDTATHAGRPLSASELDALCARMKEQLLKRTGSRDVWR
jgi:hypothetical protein